MLKKDKNSKIQPMEIKIRSERVSEEFQKQILKKLTRDSLNNSKSQSMLFMRKSTTRSKPKLQIESLTNMKAFNESKRFSLMLKENKFKSYLNHTKFNVSNKANDDQLKYKRLLSFIPVNLRTKIKFKTIKEEENKKIAETFLNLNIERYNTEEELILPNSRIKKSSPVKKLFITSQNNKKSTKERKNEEFFDSNNNTKRKFYLNQIYNSVDEMFNYNELNFFYLNRKQKIPNNVNTNKTKIEQQIIEKMRKSHSAKVKDRSDSESTDIGLKAEYIKTFKEKKNKNVLNFKTNKGLVRGFLKSNKGSQSARLNNREIVKDILSTKMSTEDEHYRTHINRIERIITARTRRKQIVQTTSAIPESTVRATSTMRNTRDNFYDAQIQTTMKTESSVSPLKDFYYKYNEALSPINPQKKNEINLLTNNLSKTQTNFTKKGKI